MRHQGFTLIELIVSIAILAILLTVAIPSFRALIINNRITTQANDFVSDITYARAEAVRRNVRVAVCQSSTGTGCGGTTTWEDGWIVFTDPDNDGILDPGETLLRVHGALTSGTTLVPTGLNYTGSYSGSYNDHLQFLPSGIVSGVTGVTPGTQGTFTLCYPGFIGRTINFNTTGRINVTTMTTNCP